jgi:YVTN family beta-propeller protein
VNHDLAANTVIPINVASNTPGTPIPVGREPTKIAITPDGKTAYVTDYLDDSVTSINISTNTASDPITVGANPTGIEITPAPNAAAQLANLLAEVTGIGSGKSLAENVKPIQADVAANDLMNACAALKAFLDEVKAQTTRN